MNTCKLIQLELRSVVVMAIASLAVCSGLQAHAQVASWAAPSNGFYDDAANWDPVGVPEATDAVVVAQSGRLRDWHSRRSRRCEPDGCQ